VQPRISFGGFLLKIPKQVLLFGGRCEQALALKHQPG
jgi:hypothetical protein